MKERRESPRIHKEYVLSYYDQHSPDIINEVTTLKDISKGGLSFSTSNNLSIGTPIGIHLRTPFHPVPVHFEGEVINTLEIVANRIYLIRVKFTILNEEASTALETAFKQLIDK